MTKIKLSVFLSLCFAVSLIFFVCGNLKTFAMQKQMNIKTVELKNLDDFIIKEYGRENTANDLYQFYVTIEIKNKENVILNIIHKKEDNGIRLREKCGFFNCCYASLGKKDIILWNEPLEDVDKNYFDNGLNFSLRPNESTLVTLYFVGSICEGTCFVDKEYGAERKHLDIEDFVLLFNEKSFNLKDRLQEAKKQYKDIKFDDFLKQQKGSVFIQEVYLTKLRDGGFVLKIWFNLKNNMQKESLNVILNDIKLVDNISKVFKPFLVDLNEISMQPGEDRFQKDTAGNLTEKINKQSAIWVDRDNRLIFVFKANEQFNEEKLKEVKLSIDDYVFNENLYDIFLKNNKN